VRFVPNRAVILAIAHDQEVHTTAAMIRNPNSAFHDKPSLTGLPVHLEGQRGKRADSFAVNERRDQVGNDAATTA